jgi:hypothetical protein
VDVGRADTAGVDGDVNIMVLELLERHLSPISERKRAIQDMKHLPPGA